MFVVRYISQSSPEWSLCSWKVSNVKLQKTPSCRHGHLNPHFYRPKTCVRNTLNPLNKLEGPRVKEVNVLTMFSVSILWLCTRFLFFNETIVTLLFGRCFIEFVQNPAIFTRSTVKEKGKRFCRIFCVFWVLRVTFEGEPP